MHILTREIIYIKRRQIMNMPHSTDWDNFIMAETKADYWAQSGDKNPVHWDEDFIRKYTKYQRMGITAPFVPGVKIAEKVYGTVKPICTQQTKSGLSLYHFYASFSKPLFYTDFPRCYWSNPEIEKNAVTIQAKVLKNSGEEIANLRFGFKTADLPNGLEHFSLIFKAARTVWHCLGIGVLLQNAGVTFLREVEAYEGIYVELSGKPKYPYGNKHRLQLNLNANSVTRNDTAAMFTVECRDCTNILHSLH